MSRIIVGVGGASVALRPQIITGAAPFEGMVIVPCSAMSMGRIAHGVFSGSQSPFRT
ncbi:MAG: hypothetical protein HN348_08605 [Proteobacteria bacterium]|nr:hypothetical protein [Pseudomonadota bacterium]